MNVDLTLGKTAYRTKSPLSTNRAVGCHPLQAVHGITPSAMVSRLATPRLGPEGRSQQEGLALPLASIHHPVGGQGSAADRCTEPPLPAPVFSAQVLWDRHRTPHSEEGTPTHGRAPRTGRMHTFHLCLIG